MYTLKNVIKLFALTVMLLSYGVSVADNPKDHKPIPPEVKSGIVKLIDHPNLTDVDFREAEAVLHFLVNAKSEIVVLLVETEAPYVDQLLKQKLNYKKLNTANLDQRYTLKVTIRNG
ncbi:MAG: hypothetical protein OEM26_02230 [Saprospiraceae bacterium]|jgi:16S rRNA A1518/A1519 N6-dimethyltransferase RsmA/KsgA/DIM1 with predicted DNA glycosylase/AP lyase activity|nr:hypothetical protein [Saprospiraceae bacterium]